MTAPNSRPLAVLGQGRDDVRGLTAREAAGITLVEPGDGSRVLTLR